WPRLHGLSANRIELGGGVMLNRRTFILGSAAVIGAATMLRTMDGVLAKPAFGDLAVTSVDDRRGMLIYDGAQFIARYSTEGQAVWKASGRKRPSRWA